MLAGLFSSGKILRSRTHDAIPQDVLADLNRRRAADYADRAELTEALKRAFGLLGDDAAAEVPQHVAQTAKPLVQRIRYDDLASDLEAAQRVLDLYAKAMQEEEETVAFLMMGLA